MDVPLIICRQTIGVLLVILCVCAGCQSLGSPSAYKPPVGELLLPLQNANPSGISLAAATQVMVDAGFHCEFIESGTFKHEITEKSELKRITYDKIDFLLCKRKSHAGMVTYWEDSALIVESGLVVKVLSNWNATGP